MSFHTPIDGEPAVAEHVAQITETLSGVRSIPVDLLSPLTIASKAVALSATAGNTLAWNADGFWSNAINQTAADARYLQSATATTTYLPLAGGSVMTGLLGPTTTNTRDLGTTALRWRKLWAVDGEFTNTPTVGGTALPTAAGIAAAYLPLAGGNLTGPLTFGGDASLSRTGPGALRLSGASASFLEVRATGSSAGAHIGQAVPGVRLDASSNVTFDGTDWNLEDTSVDGSLLGMAPSNPLNLRYFSAGANPATPRIKTFLSVNTTGTLSLTPDAGSPGLVVGSPSGTGSWGRNVNRIGQAGAVSSDTASASLILSANSRYDGAGNYALVTGASTFLGLATGDARFWMAPSVAAGASQAFVNKATFSNVGTLTLTPDAGQAAISAGANHLALSVPSGYAVMPITNNTGWLGNSANKWEGVYATAGTINTSSRTVKEGITPLDPAACYQAAKDVRWYEFAYLPPVYQEPEPPPEIAYDAADDNETKAEKKALRDEAESKAKAAHLKMVAETAPARHQRGFVFPDGPRARDEAGSTLPPVPALFGLPDRQSTTPQADLATLGCALQELIRRFEAYEVAHP